MNSTRTKENRSLVNTLPVKTILPGSGQGPAAGSWALPTIRGRVPNS
jgi:hypothetical protein